MAREQQARQASHGEMMAQDHNILLTAERISKRFGITQALNNVSVSFRNGEVHALMGENGAGKSTLGKVIAGLHKQDEGVVTIAGRVLKPGSIDDAFSAGVRIVHQELAQCPNLSVAENLCLHDLPRLRFGTVDRARMRERAAKLVHRLEPSIDVDAELGTLSPGLRQICQIASALEEEVRPGCEKARVIVFDEPTSSLSIAETEKLLEIVRSLAREGLTIIYVSHRMGEIYACCDRVTVLRDGAFVATSDVSSTPEPDLVEQMIGRRLETPTGRIRTPGGEAATLRAMGGSGPRQDVPHDAPRTFEVIGMNSPGKLRDVSFSVRAGEVLGIGGLVGSGRSELLNAIFALDSQRSGVIRLEGVEIDTRTPQKLIAAGVGYVPEDRRVQGLFFDLGVAENIVVPYMQRLAAAIGMRSLPKERTLVTQCLDEFRVKSASPSSLPNELSGGNQQKLLIARWMQKDAKVLLLDEPTRGIDIGTKAEIYRLIHAAADRGVAIVLVSSEMPELLALSDRVLVMAEGTVRGELTGDEMTQRNILTLATREARPAMAAG
ncbi:MAG: sugar ABC transporter ATP-binding protein [Phycisphaeraceae bacterium]|nr:sugar ABC transporter ATP-binding protein [Phycisphaeraceae bacterium]MCW5763504.1 sugar ABC transporter ATP-binding protein [Phycisphaeraceae bacterium]